MKTFTLTVAVITEEGQRAMAFEAVSNPSGPTFRAPAPLGSFSSDEFAYGSMIVIGLGQLSEHLSPGDRLTIASPIPVERLKEGRDWGAAGIVADVAQRYIDTIRKSGVEVRTRLVDENDLGLRRTQRLAREGLGDPRAALAKMEAAAPMG